jgi:mannose-6-phosphate isomerase-like protein (cupin superfamily)
MTQFMQAAVAAPGSGSESNIFGRHVVRVTGAQTGGAMGVWEDVVEPGDGPPLHIHTREDELFHVIEGRFRFWSGDECVSAEAGTTLVLPRRVPHRFENIGDACGRLLVAVTPGGFENFFLDLEREQVGTLAAAEAVAARYGLIFLPADTATAVGAIQMPAPGLSAGQP